VGSANSTPAAACDIARQSYIISGLNLEKIYEIKSCAIIQNTSCQTDTIRRNSWTNWRLNIGSRKSRQLLRTLHFTIRLIGVYLPGFLWDFPDCELKEYLAPIIKMRALLKLVDIHSVSRPHRVLNQDEKTVARIVYEEIRSSRNQNAPALVAYLWIKPVRGYPKYSQNLSKRFKAAGLRIDKEESLYFKALAAAGKEPGTYSAKVNIKLDPRMPSDEATKTILRFLLQIMRINQPYIEKDLDTEFLHDFRVSVRRTRSALGQIKSVFPVQTTILPLWVNSPTSCGTSMFIFLRRIPIKPCSPEFYAQILILCLSI
jgi:hypothetical protein